MTGDADKDFVAMMIPHLQGTIDMAKVELKYGKDFGSRMRETSSTRRRKSFMRDQEAKQSK